MGGSSELVSVEVDSASIADLTSVSSATMYVRTYVRMCCTFVGSYMFVSTNYFYMCTHTCTHTHTHTHTNLTPTRCGCVANCRAM